MRQQREELIRKIKEVESKPITRETGYDPTETSNFI